MQQTYLGVGVESLQHGYAAHLPKMLPRGEGVLVHTVIPGTPAEKAGIRKDDILVTYDDQKIFSAEQLAKLVMSDRPDREVTLGIVRQGSLEHIRVALGPEARGKAATHHVTRRWHSPWFGEQTYLPRWSESWSEGRPAEVAATQAPHEQFESIFLKKMDDQHFKLEVQYADKDGKIQTRQFAGTGEEIVKKINADANLPADERHDAVRSIQTLEHPLAGPEAETETDWGSNMARLPDELFGWPTDLMTF